MISWRGPAGGDGEDGPLSPNAKDHPDFDGKGYKRRLLTLEDYNRHAEHEGWGTRVREDLDFARPELKVLRDLWFAIADRKKATPARADFDARVLKPYLPHVGLVDCVPQASGRSRYRIRLQGTELARLFGEHTGRFIDEYFPRRNLVAWEMGYDVAIDAGRPVRFVQKFALPLISHLEGESFSAPLAPEGKSARGLLTALYVKPKEGVIADAG
jgi:hypothetical protein